MRISFRGSWAIDLAALSAAGSAQRFVEYEAQTELGSDAYSDGWSGETAGAPLDHTSDQPGFGFASTFAGGGYGVNRAAVKLRGTTPSNPVTYGLAFAGSSYFDGFTIDNDDLNGRSGWSPPPSSSAARVGRPSTTGF